MQVRPRAVARAAHIADKLALLYHRARSYYNRGHMGIARLPATSILNENAVVIGRYAVVTHAAMPASLRIRNSASGAGINRGAHIQGNVNAFMVGIGRPAVPLTRVRKGPAYNGACSAHAAPTYLVVAQNVVNILEAIAIDVALHEIEDCRMKFTFPKIVTFWQTYKNW